MSSEELKMVEYSSALEKIYVKANDSVEDRFFNTIRDFGTDQIKDMLKISDDGLSNVREFYNILKGEKCEYTRLLLNK